MNDGSFQICVKVGLLMKCDVFYIDNITTKLDQYKNRVRYIIPVLLNKYIKIYAIYTLATCIWVAHITSLHFTQLKKLNTLTFLSLGFGFLLFCLHGRHIISTICAFTCIHCQQVSVLRINTIIENEITTVFLSISGPKISYTFFVSIEYLNIHASDLLCGL